MAELILAYDRTNVGEGAEFALDQELYYEAMTVLLAERAPA
jgi:hypothetical protein